MWVAWPGLADQVSARPWLDCSGESFEPQDDDAKLGAPKSPGSNYESKLEDTLKKLSSSVWCNLTYNPETDTLSGTLKTPGMNLPPDAINVKVWEFKPGRALGKRSVVPSANGAGFGVSSRFRSQGSASRINATLEAIYDSMLRCRFPEFIEECPDCADRYAKCRRARDLCNLVQDCNNELTKNDRSTLVKQSEKLCAEAEAISADACSQASCPLPESKKPQGFDSCPCSTNCVNDCEG